ncbi:MULTISPECIES: DUF2854 domain-containing protein [Prochlorococcus]|uniref:Uncharacterized membrane protein n=1 Tax=Prochlorococcus marinus (strain SARG / CCMP1375 / SS120) TaxID=167539 RepID=Q7VD83_PROMA|nr:MULTISPECIES: DUF2854 domain-containing protein [Prochlorococcus]AAP99545.1 Uncharacterized membrane protein [Prochlorococcus marinus subsp. marinus str. CCMP1375]KGG11182.1 hypothetical protein EV04_1257 [Prochlorococcus marinus str. LG]KGG21520.1 hypothetical protein EV08_0607 [Prochlorococcus marinus str. SS2]KGG23135.1 hypothetical protein EV09_1881 [Prochlorococcus marinus str. SS35]KGG33846.1 hypothetical protein EV10_0283 [Prochlorococcus marinus str. SS51]
MKQQFSPASIVSLAGAILAVTGLISFFNDATNLSVPTFFYGVPILLIGLAMKNSELNPAESTISSSELEELKSKGPKELSNLIGDVTRFRYGQRAHLESSLQALKLWDENKPPQLREIELIQIEKNFGVRMKFDFCGVPLQKWQEKKDRLGRFFAKDLIAEISSNDQGELFLELLPKASNTEK